MQRRQKLQLQNRISTPKQKKKTILKHFVQQNKKENHQRQNWENLLTNHYRSLDAATLIRFTMSSCKRQQYYARCRGANQPWRSHYNAICKDWITKHTRTTRNGVRNCSSKSGSRRQSKKNLFWSTLQKNFSKENHQRHFDKICWQITIAALMQPLQYDLRCPATKDNSLGHTAAAPSNLDAAITMRSAEAELQNTLAARTTRKNVSKMMSELQYQFHCAADPRMIPAQTNVFRNRPPDKLPNPSARTHFVLQNLAFRASAISQKRSKTHFVRDRPQKLKAEDVKTKLSYETSLKTWKWKMWKRSFRAKPPSKSESGRCENEAFVRDLPENMKVEDVKTKLSCETALKIWKWKMWKRSFRAWFPSNFENSSCENEAWTVRYCDCSDIVIVVVVIVLILWLWWNGDSSDIVVMLW